jgi:predicted GIY-YIG superfamily endonuclease
MNEQKEKKTKIYVLRLEQNKWYIGKTDRDVDERFAEHLNGQGAEWTKKYMPIEIVHVRNMESPMGENMTTLEYMLKYGYDNVRGGAFVNLALSESDKESIKKQLSSAKDECFRCHKRDHVAKNCPIKQKDDAHPPERKKPTAKKIQVVLCYNCGLAGHYANQCFAESEDESDCDYDNHCFCCFRCGRDGHWVNECYASTDVYGNKL